MTAHGGPVRPRDDGELKYLVYTSVATREMSPGDLESILLTARAHNLEAEITGVLLYRDGSFIQFLEGPPAEIDSLMDSIVTDDRHTNVRVVLVERVSERSFGDWRMGFGIPERIRPAATAADRDSFEELTSPSGYEAVRRSAEDLSVWFRVKERVGSTA